MMECVRRIGIATATLLSFMLAGCASLEAMRSNVRDVWGLVRLSMSGVTLRQPQEYVQDAVQEVTRLKEDVEGRVDNIGEGVQKLKEGSELIKKGLGTATGSIQVDIVK